MDHCAKKQELMIIIYRAIVVLLTLTVFTVQANDLVNAFSYHSGILFINQNDGLVVNIPAHESHDVLSQLQTLRAELNANKDQFTKDVENTRFKTSDTIITIVMPGGLLYAANKKRRHAQAKKELRLVTAQLNGFMRDLDFLQDTASKTLLASR